MASIFFGRPSGRGNVVAAAPCVHGSAAPVASLTHYGQGSWESARPVSILPVSILKEIVAGSRAVAKKFNQAEKFHNLTWTSAVALLGIIGLVM
ncbi:MAG: hypothetical protein IID53_09295 [Proteobacteria bacterium]|nr:hypothetical protein [Pseudomonadota bacterium]